MNPLWVNSITLYLRWLWTKLRYHLRYPVDGPWIDYMVTLSNAKLGKKTAIYKYSRIVNSTIGDYTYIAKNTHVTNASIGKFCSIGPNVWIGLGKHPTRQFVSTHPVFYSNRKQIPLQWVRNSVIKEFGSITIGNDVWIGAHAMILDDVTIGDGAIIGAGAIVTKNVPPYAIVAGIPATIQRYRFDPKTIDFLLQFQWWNKDIEWIKQHRDLFLNIEQFMQHFGPKS